MNLFNLFGKLTLDTSDYERGIDDARSSNESFEASTSKTSAATAGKWAAVAAAIMAVAKVIKGLVVDATQYTDKIMNMAQLYGYTTKEIQEMMSVAEQSGKSIEEVLKGIRSSGQTAAEYLGLTVEEYKSMVEEAYRYGIILSDEAIRRVDAFGDRVSYLKAEWTAAISALLADEEGAEEAVEQFFKNVEKTVDDYAPMIIKFTIRLTLRVMKAVGEVLPEVYEDLMNSFAEYFISFDWYRLGFIAAKGIIKGLIHGLGNLGKKIFGITDEDVDESDSPVLRSSNIGSNDYEVTENVTQKIDVSLRYDGDTPIGRENAELVGGAVASQIDAILGRRLNG